MNCAARLGLLGLLSLPGCARDPVANFSAARIEAVCGWYDRCGTLLQGGYQTIEDCRAQLASAAKQSAGTMLCDNFSQGEADACIATWDDADCETPPDLTICESVCEN